MKTFQLVSEILFISKDKSDKMHYFVNKLPMLSHEDVLFDAGLHHILINWQRLNIELNVFFVVKQL